CASSIMMANVRPRCSLPISSRMTGNFCTVEMMIFLPSARNLCRSPRALRVAYCGADLRELPDSVADLLVEDPPVGDDDDRVEYRRLGAAEPDELVGQPGNGVALATARRVLDQVTSSCAVLADVGEELPHHVELVEARPDLRFPLPTGPLVFS